MPTDRKPTRRTPGPIAQDPGRRRSIRLKISLSPTEQRLIKLRAASVGLPPAVYVRRSALAQRLPQSIPPINRDSFRVLAGIGANLNQLLHHLNSHSGLPYPATLPDLNALYSLLLSVKRLLLGQAER